MTDESRMVVQVGGDDDESLASAAARLREELLGLDVDRVDPLDDDAPERAKGLGAAAGWLVVQIGAGNVLKAVVAGISSWAARNKRTVEITLGDDVLKVSGATNEQQERIIDAWLARHGAGS